MKKKLALLLAALCLLLALTGCGEKEQSVYVTLYNQSGHDITSVCITPASSDDWGENFLDETLADGNGVTIGLGTYKESEVPTEWNILVYGEEDCILYETDVDEVDFTMHDGDCVVFQSHRCLHRRRVSGALCRLHPRRSCRGSRGSCRYGRQ